MTHSNTWLSRIALISALGLFFLFGLVGSAQAQSIVGGERIPEGVTFENDAFLSGDNVVIDGRVLGDVLAIGRNVTINGDVAGSLIALAEKVTINGKIEGSTYAGALTMEIMDQAEVDRSVYYGGASLFTEPKSQIGRDLAFASLGANTTGSVSRDVQAITGLEIINQAGKLIEKVLESFGAQVDIPDLRFGAADGLQNGQRAIANLGRGIISIGPGRSIRGLYAAPAAGPLTQLALQTQEEPANQAEDVAQWFLVRLRQFVQLLIVGVLVAWLRPARFRRSADRLRARPGASTLYGFVGLISGFVATPLLLFLVVAIGIGLAYLKLAPLSVTFLGLSLSAIGFVFWLFIIVLIFISKAVVAYWGGTLILGRLLPKGNRFWIWPLLLGLVIYVFLSAIPFLGVALGFLVATIGLGAVLLAFGRVVETELILAEDEEE